MIPDAVRGNGQTPRPLRAATLEQAEFQLHEMVMNTLAQRQTYFQQMMDPRRDLDKECGYPSTYAVGADLYRTLYDREPIATRVVQLMPKECWQVLPRVYEDESSKNVTEFEQAWDDLGKQITSEKSWHQDEEGSTVWAELAHADILSGLGSFGIILLGLDDGKDFREPVEGAISDKYVRDRSGKVKTTTNGAAKIDLRKLSLPTPLPQETHLDSLVANSRTPDSKHWKDGSGRVDKHVPFDPSQALSPAFVRNEKGQHSLVVKNTHGEQITTNEFRSVGDMVQGTDAQYMGVQLGISQYPVDKPVDSELNLTFLRSFSEDLVQIVQYEANVRNPRFGMPVMYRITFNDPRETHSGIGLPIASIYVHWTRVVHLFESPVPGSKTFGVPRLRPVLNPVLDVRKIRGSGAEGYWQSCFPGIALSTHPQLGGEVVIDQDKVKDNIENYMNTLQRWLVLSGMGANTLAPTVTDPTPHINIQIEAICIQLGCPVRVFKGSERGELASSQDDSSWNDRLRHRQNTHITPGLICKFIDRLILLGVLPEPEGYSIEWPDLDSVSLKDKAGIFSQRMTAFSTYASGQVETMLPVRDMLTREAGYDEEEADAIIEANQKAQEEQMTQTMPPAGEEGHPATVKPPQPPGPITLGPGQTMVPHPDNPNTAGQKPFTAPGKPAPTIAGPTPPQQPKQPPTKNEEDDDYVENSNPEGCNQYKPCESGGEKEPHPHDRMKRSDYKVLTTIKGEISSSASMSITRLLASDHLEEVPGNPSRLRLTARGKKAAETPWSKESGVDHPKPTKHLGFYTGNRWVTLPNGAHIEIGEDGEITKGPKIDKDEKGTGAHGDKDDTRAAAEKRAADAKKEIQEKMRELGIEHEEDVPTATVLPGAGGYEQGSPQEKAYIAGEKVRGALKEGGKKAAKLAMGFGKKLGKKIAGSKTGQRVKDEFKEAGDVVREAAGKVGGFFKSLRKKIGLTKNEFVSFQEAVISGFDHEVYPEARAMVLNIAKKDSTVAAWWYALQDSPTDNSNPGGCNQYTGPGCSTGGESKGESDDPYMQPPKPSTPEKIASEPKDAAEHFKDALTRAHDRTKYPRDETERIVEKMSSLDTKTLKSLIQSSHSKETPVQAYVDKWTKAGMLSGVEKYLDVSWQMWERVSA